MKCPNCGCELRIVSVDEEQRDEKYFQYFEGICEECGSSYEWYDMYEYTETSEPRQIDQNNHL